MAAETEIERLIVRLLGDNRQYKKMLKESQQTTEVTMNAMGRAIDKQTGRFVKGQKSMQAALKRTGTLLKKTGKQIRQLGTRLTIGLTVPLGIIAGLAVKSFSSFDDAMTKSTSIMKVTEQQIASMRETALELSAGGKVVQAPKDLAASYFFLASAGKSAEQSMALLPKVAAFATAGAFDMALATDLLTDAQSALGLSSKNVAKDTQNLVRLGDLLVGANTLANASVQQFATSLTSKAGAAFKSFNIEIEDGIALLAAFADQGIKAELAGNAVDRLLRLLAKSALDNADEFKRMNINVFDAQGEFNKFQKIIGDLEKALAGMSTQQKVAALDTLGFKARVQGVILPLLGTSDAIGRYRKELKGMGDITQQVADNQLTSFANQWKQLKNLFEVARIELGQQLAPALLSLNEVLSQSIQKWRELNPSIQKFVIISGVVAATLGPVLIAFGLLTSLSGQVAIAISAMIPIIKAINVAFVALGISSTAAWAAVTLGISLAIPALIGVVVLLKKVQDKFGIFDPIVDAAKELWSTLKKELTPIFEVMVKTLQTELFPALVDIVGALGQLMNAAIPLVPLFAQQLVTAIKVAAFVVKHIMLPPILALAKALKIIAATINFVTGQDITNKSNAPRKQAVATAPGIAKSVLTQKQARKQVTGVFPGKQPSGGGTPTGISEETEAARKSADELINSFVLQSRTMGMTIRQAEIYKLKLTDITQEQRQQLIFADRWLTKQEKLFKVDKDMESFIKELEKSVDTFGMSADEIKLMDLATNKALNTNLEYANSLIKVKEAQEKWQEDMDAGKQIITQSLTPLEKFRKKVDEINRLFKVGAFDPKGKGPAAELTKNRAIQAARKELDDLQKKANIQISVSGFDAAIAGSAEAANRIEAFRDLQVGSVVDQNGPKDQGKAATDTAKNTNDIATTNKKIVTELKKANKKPSLQTAGFTK